MITFSKLTLDDIEILKPYFNDSKNRACDNTIGGTFMWRDFFETAYAIYKNTLIIKVKFIDGRTTFSVPIGENVEKAIDEINKYCNDEKIQTVFCMATAREVEILQSKFKTELISETNWSDYLYIATDLANFSGRRYNGQRNHMNAFKKAFPDYRYEEMSRKNLKDVSDFYKNSSLIDKKESVLFIEDQKKVFEVLENFEKYDLFGGIIFAEEKIVAFSLGEIINDTLYVHIEKAETSIRGSYQMIVNEFAKHNISEKVFYINREDDAGDEGLRKSKLSYHPCEIIQKFTVNII